MRGAAGWRKTDLGEQSVSTQGAHDVTECLRAQANYHRFKPLFDFTGVSATTSVDRLLPR